MAENVPTTSVWNPAINFLIGEAYRDINVVDDEEDPTGAQYDRAAYRLNAIIKTMAASGIHVWAEAEGMIFLQQYIPEYLFNGTGTATPGNNSMLAMACDAESWTQYQLQQSYPAGFAGALTVGAPCNSLTQSIAVSDNFGVVLDSGSVFWTTVASITGQAVTLNGALPVSASFGNYTMDYPTSAQLTRPLRIPRSRQVRYTPNGPILTPMTRLSRQEYMDLPQPLTPGTPIQHFYSPQRGIGRWYFWNNPQNGNWGARFTFYRELADYLVPNNTLDFPQEWIMPLRWLLAYDMGLGHSVPEAKWAIIEKERDAVMMVVTAWDKESEDVQFGLDWSLR